MTSRLPISFRASVLLGALVALAACGDDAAVPLMDSGTDAAADASADTGVSQDAAVDPIDLDEARVTFERVFAALGLDPESPADLRQVWEQEEPFESYLRAWEAERGVVFERRDRRKAECLFLDSFDPTISYCGPGCDATLTFAPPCLNRGCFEHDACYGAIECRSGEAIDEGLSFSALTECCDAPLAPAREECDEVVARGLAAGDLNGLEVELYLAIRTIMVGAETSELFDTPTDRPPATCDETYAEACAPGELDVSATPSSVGSEGSVEVCSTLTRSGRPVGRWTATPQPPALGSWSESESQGMGEDPVCISWTAPPGVDGSEPPVELEIHAEVLAESIASGSATVTLEDITLLPEGADEIEVSVGDAESICFLAELSGAPFVGASAAFSLFGDGSLSTEDGVTDDAGRICVDYTAPDAVPAAADVLGVTLGSIEATVQITVVDDAVSLSGLATERTAGCGGNTDRTAIRVDVTDAGGAPVAGISVEFLLDGSSIGFATSDAAGVAEFIYAIADTSMRVVLARADGVETSGSFLFANAGGPVCDPCPGHVVTPEDVTACTADCPVGDDACLATRACQCQSNGCSPICGCTPVGCSCCCGCM